MDEKESIKIIRRRLAKLGYKLHVGAPNAFARYEVRKQLNALEHKSQFFLDLPSLEKWVDEQEQSNAPATV